MSDNKKYYYMRLKDNFFDSDNMILLESMPDGYLYSNILLKLYLRSLKDDGRLMLNGRIPYNPQMLATVTRHQIGTVEKALHIFKELGLIEVLDNGAIYMMDIQNYIGESSSEGDRKRLQRKRVDDEKKTLKSGQMSGQMSDKFLDKCTDEYPPELELELELEKEIEIEREKESTDDDAVDLSMSIGSKLKVIIKEQWKREASYNDMTMALKYVVVNGKADADRLTMFEIAMQLSSRKEKSMNWNYVDAIYSGWKERNITTPAEWLEYEQSRKGGTK